MVGDDDQSIYAWRGANPENLRRLKDDFPRLEVVKLEQNYRSAGCILKCANQLIANNPHVFEKRLWSALGYGSPLKILGCRDGDHEAERVVSEILHHQFTHGTRHGEYAILYRGNRQSRGFEKVLREHAISYHLSGGTSFFEYAEVKDLIAYLRLLVNNDDDRAFLRVVNTPRRELGAATLEKLGAFASQQGLGLLAACFETGLAECLNKRALTRLQEFAAWAVALGDAAQRGDATTVVHQLIKDIDYRAWLEDNAKDSNEAERRLQNVDELIGWLERMGKPDEQAPGLADMVNRISLLDRLHRQGVNKKMIASARNYIMGQFPPTLETAGSLASMLAYLELNGLDRSYIDGYGAALDAVTPVTLHNAISEVYPVMNDLVIVLIGDAEAIREAVTKYGPVTEEELDGFADERGAPDYNQSLSERRVQFIRDQFVAAGVHPDRIRSAAHGESVAQDESPDSFAFERRVSVKLFIEDSPSLASN